MLQAGTGPSLEKPNWTHSQNRRWLITCWSSGGLPEMNQRQRCPCDTSSRHSKGVQVLESRSSRTSQPCRDHVNSIKQKLAQSFVTVHSENWFQRLFLFALIFSFFFSHQSNLTRVLPASDQSEAINSRLSGPEISIFCRTRPLVPRLSLYPYGSN